VQPRPVDANFPVDLIRTIAIFLVVLVHTSNFPYHPVVATMSSSSVESWFSADVYSALGNLGVPLFVLISGALLLDPAKADEPMKVFFKKRFNRIGLPFMFWTAAYFAWNHYIHGATLSLFNIENGLLQGSYNILWFLYLIVGLYLVTPALRVLVKYIDRERFSFLLVLWFIGTVSVPLIHLFAPSFNYNPVIVVVYGWVGYFLLGIFLLKTKVRPWILYLVIFFGILGAVLGEWLITESLGQTYTGLFHDPLSFDIIIIASAVFLVLTSVPKSIVENNQIVSRAVHWIGQNTLSLYLIHMMVLETLTLGLLGFTLPSTGNAAIDMPLYAVIVLLISAAIVYALKKIRYAGRIIG